MPHRLAESIAFELHKTQQKLSPEFSSKTASGVPVYWEDLPKASRNLMIATVDDLLKRGVIHAGPST